MNKEKKLTETIIELVPGELVEPKAGELIEPMGPHMFILLCGNGSYYVGKYKIS